MPNHFRAFAKATGDNRWLKLIDYGYSIMDQIQTANHTGWLPDFVIVRDGQVRPAPLGRPL